jgi:molybdopterin biosynthesis enzyme
MSEALIPDGADAVVSQEFASDDGETVLFTTTRMAEEIYKKGFGRDQGGDHRNGDAINSASVGLIARQGMMAPRSIRTRTSPLSQRG